MKRLIILLLVTQWLHADIIDELIPVLSVVESNNNLTAVGDNGNAYGHLQIWEVVVKDVNRVYKTNYKHEHMFFYHNSCEVAYLYLTYWGNHYTKVTGKKPTKEVLARIWNGGPNGYKKESTIKYWEKVKCIERI